METNGFSQKLIRETIKCFKEEDGISLSENEAIAILESFAGLFLAFAGQKPREPMLGREAFPSGRKAPDLISELIELLDKVDLDELGIKSRIEDEISRFNKFRTGVLGHKQEKVSLDVDVRNYAKYLLKNGTLMEKRELLSCLKSELVLKEKKILLE